MAVSDWQDDYSEVTVVLSSDVPFADLAVTGSGFTGTKTVNLLEDANGKYSYTFIYAPLSSGQETSGDTDTSGTTNGDEASADTSASTETSASSESTAATVYSLGTIVIAGTTVTDGESGTIELPYTETGSTENTTYQTEEINSVETEQVYNHSDFIYSEDGGSYIWVDGTGNGDGSYTASVPVGKIYYRTEISCNNMFATHILELVGKTDAAENDDVAIRKIHVHTYTPSDLEAALSANELALNGMDLVYVSNSGILQGSGFDRASYKDVDTTADTYVNDLSWDTAFNIYEYAVNTNLPVILDHSIMLDNGTDEQKAADLLTMVEGNGTTDSGNNILRLSYLFRNYVMTGEKAVEEAGTPDIWTESFVENVVGMKELSYGTYGLVQNSIFINMDDGAVSISGETGSGNGAQFIGNLVCDTISDSIFVYESTKDNNAEGETVVSGMTNIVNEISNDNFYNNTNGDEFTLEYVEIDGEITVTVSRATLVKYILNYNLRRVTLYKDTIRVLDLEPTKYSTLSEDDIRGWLGIESGSYSVTVTENPDEMTFDESDMTVTGQDGQYDYHTWISSNNKVITVTGSNRTGKLILLGAGTATITHEYGYYYHGYKYPYYESITLSVTANEASESHVKEITIDQYSTSEFIGKLDDLIETYDMVYIGDCIGPEGAAGSLYQDYYGNATYNDTNLNKKIYLHTGDLVKSADRSLRGLLDVDKDWNEVSTRYSGNDITEDKYRELLEYAQAGYPIVVSSKFYDGKAVSDTYLDNSSYIYKLIKAVANGFEATRTLTEEEYQKAVTEFGSEEAAAGNGYKKTVNTSYSKDVTTTLTNKKLTKVTDIADLNTTDSYIIASANTTNAEGYAYKVIDADLTLKDNLKTALSGYGNDSVTVSASAVENSYLWKFENIRNNRYNGRTCYLKNNNGNGQYLTIQNNSSVYGATLQNNVADIQLSEGNINGTVAFYVSEYNYNKWEWEYSYLNARTDYNNNIARAGTYTDRDNGSSWYIYKVEDTEGETLTSREPITAAEYQEAEAKYGAANMETNGYFKSTWTTYTYTQNLSGVPNVMNDNETKTVINKLVKYINMPRLNLVMIKTPTPYTSTTDKSGNLSSVRWLESEGGKYYLKYEFEFANTAEATGGQSTYALQLYVDVNADGRYVPAEELDGVDVYEAATLKSVPADQLSSGVRYTASRELPQGYVGMLPWKFVISMNTGSSNELTTVRSSEIGYTAIENTSKNPTLIRVLEITPSSSALSLKKSYFPDLFASVEEKMNYKLDITSITVDELEDMYDEKDAYGNREYTGSVDFYEKFLKEYDMLVWGFADMYGSKDFSDDVIKAFGLFIDSGKATLFSHDLTSFNNGYYGNNGKNDWGYHMNQYLRSAAGMDRFGITETSLDFLKGKTGDYNLTEEEEARIQIAKKDIASKDTSKASSASSADTSYLAQGFANGFLNYYKTSSSQMDTYGNGYNRDTESISQTNEGQITLYPFDITIAESVSDDSSETWTQRRDRYSGNSSYYVEETAKMEVAPTHYQYYQLDFNYDTDNDGTNNLVVWYTLADTSYENVPNDVRNNYYIYSVGNVTYTGMGHNGTVTQKEAQLFVNTIIAAYNAGNKNPGVNIVQDTDNRNTSIDYIYRTFDESSPSDNNQDESFAFYVDDTNMIQGTKTIESWYYYEIPEASYQSALNTYGTVEKANEAGYYEVKDDNGKQVWLKAYSSNSSASDYIGNVLSEYKTTVDNKIAEQVTVKASWINSHLANAAEGNATIWIGAFTKLDYAAVNKETEYTDRVFDCVTFKKRNLTILD